MAGKSENETNPSNVVQFPYSACRRVHSRRPRTSKNGTPEDRAAREAAAAFPPVDFAMKYEALPLAERQMISDMVRADLAKSELDKPEGEPKLSEPGRNKKLRLDRRAAWRRAKHKLDYWSAYQKLHFAIYNNREVLDDLECPAALRRKHGDFSEPWILDNELLNRAQAAEVDLLLTPAPDVASLNWKQRRVKHQWYQPPNADTEYLRRHYGHKQSPFRDIEHAIADDEAWLEAHPARQQS